MANEYYLHLSTLIYKKPSMSESSISREATNALVARRPPYIRENIIDHKVVIKDGADAPITTDKDLGLDIEAVLSNGVKEISKAYRGKQRDEYINLPVGTS